MLKVNSRTLSIVLAFLAVYVIWGSTYLAIKFALAGFPPFVMAGVRFLIAGSLMYGYLMTRSDFVAPTRAQWRSAAIIGVLLLAGGNGGVVCAEQTVPSGMVSLLVSVVPIWITLADWIRPGGRAPGALVMLGLCVGLGGVAMLLGPAAFSGVGTVNLWGAACVMLGSLSWSAGSVMSRHCDLPKNAFLATAMEMLAGGVSMVLIACSRNEFSHINLHQVSMLSVASVAYLIVFGSIIGFSAYIWLLKMVSAPRVATYAYVNPLVAVFLGWMFAGESVGLQTLVAAAVIVSAVALITGAQGKAKTVEDLEELEEEFPGPAHGIPALVRK